MLLGHLGAIVNRNSKSWRKQCYSVRNKVLAGVTKETKVGTDRHTGKYVKVWGSPPDRGVGGKWLMLWQPGGFLGGRPHAYRMAGAWRPCRGTLRHNSSTATKLNFAVKGGGVQILLLHA